MRERHGNGCRLYRGVLVTRRKQSDPANDGDEKPVKGRPTVYSDEMVPQVEKLCELGATDADVAHFLEIQLSTLYRWKLEHQAFSEALKRGKEVADATVEDRLFKRATGYSHEAVKIFMPAGASEPVYAPYTEHVPPDTTAMIFWLKNRRPAQWRDQQVVKHEGEVTVRSAAVSALAELIEDSARGTADRAGTDPLPN